MNTQDDGPLLRRALLGNATFSALCGTSLLVGAGSLEPHLGAPALALRVIGISLLPFAFGLWRNARRPRVQRGEAWVAVALDLTWVAGSATLILGELWPLRPAGIWAVIGVADVVLLCAVLQALGLWRSAPRAARAH